MNKRHFITLLGAAAATWPLAARAQQAAMSVIGLVRTTAPEDSAPHSGVQAASCESGFVEGRNVAIEYHCALNQIDRLRVLVPLGTPLDRVL
jgi:putative ABC transport system substrate-binding protein